MNSITFFMKAFYLSLLLSFSFLSFGQKQTSTIGFIENKGQIIDQKGKENKDVKYLLNTNGLNVQLRNNGFSYDVYEVEKVPLTKKNKEFYSLDSKEKDNKPDFSTKINFHRIDIDFLNSNKNSQLFAEEKSTDYDNYYNVIHVPNGITNVHKYQKVTYKNIYNNIDVVFFIPKDSTKVVEYNFIVKPGGKVSDIQLKFNGAKTDLIDNKIQMNLRFGKMEETLPLSWVENNNQKQEISINYKRIKKNVYGFDGDFNKSDKTIVIDPVPVRLWGTYYGGNGIEVISFLSVDNNNDLYICGGTSSINNIATSGVFISNYLTDIYGYVSKFNPDGIRIWGTYHFGEHKGVAVDNLMNYIFVGETLKTTNISTVGSHQPIKNVSIDGFICKLNSSGLREWSSYYGGNKNDQLRSVTTDNDNNIYVCGSSNSPAGISTANSHQTNYTPDPNATSSFGPADGIIIKFTPSGNRVWATYYGGEKPDVFYNCYISEDNFLYFTGISQSVTNISTSGSFQENLNGNSDAIIIKFNLNGDRVWGSYLGGESGDRLDNRGEIKNNFLYLVGDTDSTTNISTSGTFIDTFPTVTGSFSSHAIIKFDLINQTKVWGTYFNDIVRTLSVNSFDEVYFAGDTPLSNNIATTDGYQPIKNQYSNCYLIKLNSIGQRVWGTYYSGNFATQNGKTKVDNLNNIYLSGLSNGNTTGISTSNSHQPVSASFQDAFLVKFLDCQSSAIANSNSPTCIGSNLQLNASGGTNYNWTGPNGFTSSDQNPIILIATVLNNGQYICEITGVAGGCDNTISLNVIVGDTIAPVPNIASLPQINGDCNTVISTIPTALDNCAGTISATTTGPFAYSIPGSYVITWNYNDGNGNSSNQTQNVTITTVSQPTLNSSQIFCFQDNSTINNIQITGQNITWYDAQTGGNIIPNTAALQNEVTYYATQTINGCESERVSVTVNIQNTAAPIGNANQTFCSTQNATLNDISITGTNIIWYANNSSTTVLPNSTPLLDNTSYFATQTVNGCESQTRLEVLVDLINTLNAVNYHETLCDDLDDGSESINLTNYNSNFIAVTGNTFSYYNSLNAAENQVTSDQINNISNYNLTIGTSTIFVRIDSQNGCHQVVELKLTLVSKPRITIDDIMPICEGTSITINAESGFDSYNWSTGATSQTIAVSQAGNYSVTVTENHNGINCSSTKNFTVVNSNVATVSEIITSDWTDNNNTISVLLTNSSVGNYVYSLDGINYQNSNVFYGLESGEYTVFVKDTNGCGISSEEVYLLMYPKFFTPNGDSYNDTWKIKFSQKERNLKIAIFDRYGKLLKTMNSSESWDGKLNGKDLPSDDYWFVVTRQNGKEFRGHFAMKR
jgi:gliding motility-associated-like protein